MASKSILVIEYEPSLRRVLSACLKELGGWKVSLSSSIQDGIRLCEQEKPHAILVDTSTPEIDALLFIEQLKRYSRERSIPIILISSRASWYTAQQLCQMGFAGAINKPFNPSTLPADISHLLSWDCQDN
jgi:CheY-like chemotaxis protein